MRRKLNIKRMRKHAARSTPNNRTVRIPFNQMMLEDSETIREKYFGEWMRKMLIKHEGQNGRFEFMVEDDLNNQEHIIIARCFLPVAPRSSP